MTDVGERFLCRTMRDGLLPLNDPMLLAAVHELKPCVFLDTAIRFIKVESENSASENALGLASDVFGLLQAGARAVVCVHHSTKTSASKPTPTLEDTLRGTGDFGAMADAVYSLTESGRISTVRADEIWLNCVKARDFEPGGMITLKTRPYIDETGDLGVMCEPMKTNSNALSR